jgi:UDP-N-acetylglucosamine diphosphorylase/glucosamine-1-phosphate N-acetyltransferase
MQFMATHPNTHIIILAAGKGTRMQSELPKVMHPIGHYPMLGHIIKTAEPLASSITLVISAAMQSYITPWHSRCGIVVQEQQLGTAHALKCALESKVMAPNDRVIVLFGDTPLIQSATIQAVIDRFTEQTQPDKGASEVPGIVVVGMKPTQAKAYGRLICNATGKLERIVEFKHASAAEKEVPFCNSGIMGFRYSCLQDTLPAVKPQPENGEYYLTDTIMVANQQGYEVHTLEAAASEVEGVNTRADLAQAESCFQERARQFWLEQGVTLLDPQSVFFAFDTRIEPDVTIEPHVFFGPGVVIKTGALIKGFSHIEGAILETDACVGPFARLRPGTKVGVKAKVGNFVEVKNAALHQGAKVNHLSYIGDAEVGEQVNVGAGTITCNYDGYQKYQTIIKKGAFIGSNTALIAPVTIGEDAIIAAGSTITKDVENGALAVARAPQKCLPNKSLQIRETKRALKFKEKVA